MISMQEVTEIIDDILPDLINQNAKNKEITNKMNILEIISMIAPGADLRIGLDDTLHGDTGALIVLGTNIVLESIIRGGFKLDVEYSPQRIFELSKMDGAIILSNDLKKILYANVHLMPDKSIPSTQTGIRHRSAEQTARQTALPVIAISKRRKIITLFYKDNAYVLQDIGFLITKASHSLRSLSNYKTQIDAALEELTYYELNNSSSFEDAIKIIQKIIYMYKHRTELERIILELGDEGKEIKQSMYEYMLGLDKELKLTIMDYIQSDKIDPKDVIENLINGDIKDLANIKSIAFELGIEKNKALDETYAPRGYRILSKIPKLSKSTIENVVKNKENLFNIYLSKEEELINDCNISENQVKLLLERLKIINDAVMNKMYKI